MFIEKCVIWAIDVAAKYPRRLLLLTAILCILSVVASVAWLRVNTDSSEMLSSELDFQVRTQALNAAFPEIKNSIVIIVRGQTPDATVEASRRLVDRLAGETGTINSVFAPASDPFFQTHGLLYQDLAELERDLEAINNAASFLAELRKDPTLDSLAASLHEALELSEGAEFDRSFLERFFHSLAEVIEARLGGRPQAFSWLDAMSAAPDESDRQAIVLVSPKLDFTAISPVRQARRAVESAISAVTAESPYPLDISLTGDPILRADELRSVATGIEYSILLSLLATFALLILAYRSAARALLTMAGLFVTLVITTGFAAVAVGALNLVSIAFCVLLIGLGLDFSIHVLAHIEEKARGGESALAALSGTARTVGSALFLAALTTALAFFAFIPTDFTGMSQLGMIGGVGVLIAFLVSVTVIPALVALMPRLAGTHLWSAGDGTAPQGFLFARRSDTTVKVLHTTAAVVVLLLAVAALTYVPDARFDADPMRLRDPDSPSVQALQPLYEDPDDAPYRLSVLAPNRDQAVALADRLDELDAVHETVTLADFVPENQDEKLLTVEISYPSFVTIVEGDGLDLEQLPPGLTPLQALTERLAAERGSPGAAALRSALEKLQAARSTELIEQVEGDIFAYFDGLIGRFRHMLDIDTVEIDDIPAPLRARFRDDSGRWRVEVLPARDIRDPAALTQFVSAVLGIAPQAAGAPLQIQRAGEVVASAMVQATLAAFAMVGVVCVVVLRRLAMVAAVLLPLAVAAILTLGGSVALSIPFNYANIIVLPLLIGMGVDSGIHLAMRRRDLGKSRELYRTSTPRAVLFSALTTIAAFASLGLSEHRGTASMGMLLTLAIGCTLASTLALTPVLLDIFRAMPQIRRDHRNSD